MRDNSPKMRQARRIERKRGERPPYPRILMVCEGETEKLYFEDIRRDYRITSANWAVMPSEYGTGPEKVVGFAEHKARSEKKWDEVYCIFDRDEHVHYRQALEVAAKLDGKLKPKDALATPPRFISIPSIPCFELWYLLHFQAVNREENRDAVT